MKTLLALAFVALFVPCFAADPIDVTSAPTVDLYDLSAKSAGLAGQVIKLKFAHRDGNMLVGYKGKLAGKVRAEVPPEGQQWFNAVSTTVSKQSTLSAYARVVQNHLEIVGRDVRGGQPIW